MFRLVSLGVLLLAAIPACGADAASRAKTIAPFVNERTIAVGYADLTRVDVGAVFDWIAEVGKVPAKEMAEPRKHVQEVVAQLTKAGVREAFVVASMDDLQNQPSYVVLPLSAGADAAAVTQLIKQMGGMETVEQHGQAIVAGSSAAVKRLQNGKSAPLPDLAKGFTAAGDAPIQGVFVFAADLRRALNETLPALPAEVGGGSPKVLTRGVQWAAVGVDLPPKASVRVVVQSADAAAAKELHGWIAGLFEQRMAREFLPDLGKMAQQLTPQVAGDQLKLTVDPNTLVNVARPMVAKVRAAAQRTELANHLKQIGIAMHVSYDVSKSLPAWASYDKQNKPLLSWRVHILPYLEADDLYKQFHLDEPWDSEHNKKLIPMMPKLYAGNNEKLAREGKTTILAPLGDATMFPIGPKGVKFAEVTDGTSNTIFLVVAEDDKAVIWTKPEDLKIDPEGPAKGLASEEGKGYSFLFVDGSVRFIPTKIDKKMLWALFTKSGGEVVNIP